MSEHHPSAPAVLAPGGPDPSAYPPPSFLPPPDFLPPANSYPTPRRSERPTPVLAAGGLAFVLAGLLVVTAFFLLVFVSTEDAWHQLFGVSGSHVAAEITVDALLDLAVAAGLIATGVSLLNRSARARPGLVSAFGATIALSGYWLLRDRDHLYALPWAVFYGAIAVAGGWLALTRSVTTWLQSNRTP
jgi:hypothetical protein